MLARRQEINTQLQVLIDGFLLAVSLWVAWVLRYYSTFWFNLKDTVDPFHNYHWLFIVIMPFGPILLDLQGFYQSPLNKTKWRSVVQIARAMIGLSIIVSACVIFLRLPLANRTVPLLFILTGTVVLLVKERLIAAHLRRKAVRGEQREPVLLAGLPQDLAALERTFTAEQRLLIDVVARIDIDRQPISDLIEAMHKHAVSRVIFAAGHSQLNRVEQAISACEVEGVPAWLVADFIQTSIAKPDFDAFAGRPMLVFRSTPEVSWALLIKDIFDRVVAFIALLLMAIPMAVVALIIRITSIGPVIFRQRRAGKYGKPFVMYKFRSMTDDAEMRRAELEPWNVLMGDMSLVGPRPLPLYEVEKFENTAQRRRLSVKPGLTCLWQISGRNQVRDFRDWVRLDLDYIDRWSLALDFKILLRTIPAVILGLGAK